MKHTTYSFLDLSGAIAHPQLGAYAFTGKGVGEVVITMATDKTVHDTAGDGSVMVTKMAGNSGSIQVKCQQTSNVHKWLLAAYNALVIAPVDQWATMGAALRNSADGTGHTLIGMSFQKVPDKVYQAQGQYVTWTLMVADIQSLAA
jgi:hypothetical protein